MDREAISNAFRNTFQSMTLKDFTLEFITPAKAIQSYLLLQSGIDDGASRFISLLFNPHRLDIKVKGQNKSLFDGIKNDNTFNGFCRLYLYELSGSTKDALRETLRRGFNGIQYVGEFPPYVARSVLLTYAGGVE